VILVAVDTEHLDDERHPKAQRATGPWPCIRLPAAVRVGARRAAPLGEGRRLDDTASGSISSIATGRARGSGRLLPQARTSFHVIESGHPAATVQTWRARITRLDRDWRAARRTPLAWWRSVASRSLRARCRSASFAPSRTLPAAPEPPAAADSKD
jgi:hypothetical protein